MQTELSAEFSDRFDYKQDSADCYVLLYIKATEDKWLKIFDKTQLQKYF